MKQYRTVIQFKEDGQVFYGQWTDQIRAMMERDHYLGPHYDVTLIYDGPSRMTQTFYSPHKCYVEERETDNDD